MMCKLVYSVVAFGTIIAPWSDRTVGCAVAQPTTNRLESPAIDTGVPEVLVPKRPRDEATEDRMLASALFTEGRLLYRREDFSLALEKYQRAYRYANGSITILGEIIPLAFNLGRLDEAARYAMLANPGIGVDPFVLRRLALHMTDHEQFDQALQLYRIAGSNADEESRVVPSVITQFEMGRLLYLTERYAEAIEYFGPAQDILLIEEPPDFEKPAIEALLKEREVTFSLIAESFLKANQPQRSERAFQLAYKDKADAPILDFHMARVLASGKDVNGALERLRRYLSSGDADAGTAPYELLSRLLDNVDKADLLESELTTLAEQQDDNVFLIYFLGRHYLEKQEPELAAQRFAQLMEIRPLVDGYRGLIRARMQQQDTDAIVDLLTESRARLGGLAAIGPVLDEIVKDPKQAEQIRALANRILQSEPSAGSASQVASALAELLARAGDSESADQLYERAASTAGDESQAWMAWGMHRLAGDKPSGGIDVFRRAIKATDDPERQAPMYFYLAAALAMDEQFDDAVLAARKAAELADSIPAIQLRPAWVLLLARRWKEAASEYQSFLDRFSDQYGSADLREQVREAKTSLASVCVYLERFVEAEQWLDEVLDEFPEHVGAQNDLGYLWADRRAHLHRALRMTEYAVNKEPDNMAYRDSYGWALHRLGRNAEAVEQLRIAAQSDPPDPIILDHLGDALEQTEGSDAAVDVWQRALDHLSDEDPQHRVRLRQKIKKATRR